VSRPKQADIEALLQALLDAQVDFIVVGGVAAVLHGAPITTQDLDIVHSRAPDNVRRLLTLLERLDAIFRDPAGRVLRPSAEALSGDGQLNLWTDLGPLDPLCRLHDGRDYLDLLASSIVLSDDSLNVRVVDLPTLIEIKSTTGRARDNLTVPILLAIQDSK